jgi:hypothetical protein
VSSSGTISADTRLLLHQAATKSGRRTGPAFPIAFVRSEQDPPDVPRMTQLLRGGRGGEVRLKLYLTMSMLATAKPHDVHGRRPSSWYAELLGLDDPMGLGARRVSDAMTWLDKQQFIKLDRKPGLAAHVQLLDVKGGGGPFKEVDRGRGKRWIVLPLEFWRNQWVIVLSGGAVAVLMTLLELHGGRKGPLTIPTERRQQYGLSPDTWARASGELVAHGLLELGKKQDGPRHEVRRVRNTYLLKRERLLEEAGP